MRQGTRISEMGDQDIDPNELRLIDLIEQFNNPAQQHILQGIFRADDGIDEIRTKQRQTELDLGRAMTQLRFL